MSLYLPMSDTLLPFPWLDLVLILALIAINGLLSMSELAIVSSREARLKAMVKAGSRGAKWALDLKDAIHVGHSTGGGEVARYIGRHGTKRVAKAVLIGAVPPLMLKTDANPGGLPMKAFDDIRAGVQADRSKFWKDLSMPFYGYNRPNAKISEGVRESFWLQGMMCGFPGSYFCIKAFSETDLTEDLKKFDVPTLILHGDDDQIVPIGASAMLSSKLVKGAKLEIYKGAPHGMCTTLKDRVNADLLAFFKT